MVAVNYDMTDYLPDSTKSTVSLQIMETEFEGGIPNARVMLHNITIPEALEYKEKLKSIMGVTAVTWLDDASDITMPLSSIPEDTLNSYYKDGTALFSVTIEDEHVVTSVEEIRNLIATSGAVTGSAVSNADATTNTVSEVLKITAIAVAFVLIVLILTTSSWIEPLVVLLGLGIGLVFSAFYQKEKYLNLLL